MRTISLFLLFSLFCVSSASAASAVSCHCFQDRQYLPQKSHAADPYFLATTQNSLMSVIYHVDKKSLVKSKMSGADNESLWIAHELAMQSGQPLAKIGQAYQEQGSWREVIAQPAVKEYLSPEYPAMVDRPDELAKRIIDHALIRSLSLNNEQLQELRKQGLTSKELILSLFLARIGGSDALGVYRRYKAGESWGKLLHDQGLFDGKSIERKWRELLTS